MQIIQFMYIFIAGVNILTLCYAEQKGSLFMNHIFNQNGPNLRIGVPNPDILNSPVTLPPIKQEKPLVVVINGLVKNLNKTNNNNSIENVTSEKTFVETSNDNVTSVNNKTSGAVQHIKYPGEDDTGALKRGSLVFLGLCVIVLACYAWKTYRLRKASSNPVMVQKYGIRTNRSDIEMRPLPLDEDDDDDTLFEVGNNTNRQ